MPFHFTQLSELQREYAHIYISPHFDDAALSCGGAISRFAGEEHAVLVVNVCSGTPPSGNFSRFAQEQHAKWRLSAEEAMQRRLREDIEALEILGADSWQLDQLDAIYRMPTAYHDEATLFGTPDSADPLRNDLLAALLPLTQRYPQAIFYAPLAIGNHVDHQIAATVASELAHQGVSVAYYEDLPYALKPDAREQRIATLGGEERFLPVVTDIDAAIERKVSAIAAYGSQMDVLFGGVTTMADQIRGYAAQVRTERALYGERIWMQR